MIGPALVVDDEPMVRKLLAEALQRAGVETLTASDGQEALAVFEEARPPLVVADLRMPGLDGLALMRAVKAASPETAVVIVTGAGDPETIRELTAEGAAHVLLKPFTFGELRVVLGRLARRPERTADEPIPVLTQHPAMTAVLDLARRVARTDVTVLIEGETGSGKEVLSRLIHRESARAGRPFVAVNCSALPESLIEAELFGHERGAFTGAVGRRVGRFEAASGGTLLLDEVTEIPLGLQAKLLRALQERRIERVGSNEAVRVDVRVIAVTNRDVRAEVRDGRFRQDLYYRLNVLPLRVPPLRERVSDVPLLASHFLARYALAYDSPAQTLTPEALERLAGHSWPGNVRELENTIQRAAILCGGPRVGPEHIVLEEPALDGPAASRRTAAEVERDLILSTLARLDGNRTHTARELGLSVRTIRNRLRDYRGQPGPPAVLAQHRTG
jgi:two-component system response regulator FlrC